MATRRMEWWTRTHRTSPAVTFMAVTSPIDGQYLVRADGWTLPEHFPLMYESLEAAQRAADNLLSFYKAHDCRQLGCGEWMPRDPRALAHLIVDGDAPRH